MHAVPRPRFFLSSATRTACAVALALGSGLATAASFSEAVNGELSGDRLAPTFLQLDFQPGGAVPGSNVVFQELGSGSFDYRFNIVLSPVPGPAALAWLLGAGLLALGAGARPGPV